MAENNNTNNNVSNEEKNENTEPEQIEVQMALPVGPPATYSTIPNNSDNILPTVQYIPPVYTVRGETPNLTQDIVTEEMVIVYQYGKSVKCLSMIDFFFGFLHFIVSPYGFISCIFPLLGYRGAVSYNKCFVDTYLGYQILYCFINVVIFINILFNKNIELPENQSIEAMSTFQIITIMLNCYFIRITKQFSFNIKTITPEQKIILLNLNFENTRGIYL